MKERIDLIALALLLRADIRDLASYDACYVPPASPVWAVKCRLKVMLYNKLVMIRKTIIGIALIVIGLSVFGTSYNEGLTGQEYYSTFLCAVVTTTKTQYTIANNQMTGGFIGMIFGFFIALFGASLVVPSILTELIKGNWRKQLG